MAPHSGWRLVFCTPAQSAGGGLTKAVMNDPHGLCRKWREVIRSEHIPLAWDREEEGDITGWEILLEEERFRSRF